MSIVKEIFYAIFFLQTSKIKLQSLKNTLNISQCIRGYEFNIHDVCLSALCKLQFKFVLLHGDPKSESN